MAKNKLKKWAMLATYPHVIQAGGNAWRLSDHSLKGKWKSQVFKNTHPLVLELGCGRGEYTVNLAVMHPECNYLGIDIKGARIWHGATRVFQEGIRNAAFLRTRIDFINSFFSAGEVNEIWLTFSDPQPDRENKRLTSPFFIEKYRSLLAPGAVIHVKTDSNLLYEYTRQQIKSEGYSLHTDIPDISIDDTCSAKLAGILSIRTFYEEMWTGRGLPIHYLSFSL